MLGGWCAGFFKRHQSTLDDEGNMTFRNVGKLLPTDTVSHIRNLYIQQCRCGRDSSVDIRAGRFRGSNFRRGDISVPAQIGPEALPASCTVGIGSFSGVKRSSTPPLGLHDLF
jgi:hypothetical protein